MRITPQSNKRDHDILLVLEMTQQSWAGGIQGVGQAGGGVGGIRSAGSSGVVQGVAAIRQGLQLGVDRVVVPVQQVDAIRYARLYAAEDRKIVTGLDVVVAVEVLEEPRQGRQQTVVESAQVHVARPIGSGDVIHVLARLTEAVMHRQPVGRSLGHGSVTPPAAGEGVTQPDEVVRQGRPIRERPQARRIRQRPSSSG